MNLKKAIFGAALCAYMAGCSENRSLPMPTRERTTIEETEAKQVITTDYCKTPIINGLCEELLPEPNYNLSKFPQPFVTKKGQPNGTIVISAFATDYEVESARMIATQLGYDQNVGCEEDFMCEGTGSSIYEFETIDSPSSRNLILVGTPCENRIISETLQTENCECKFREGSIFGHTWLTGATTLYVSGPTGQEVYEAAKMLTEARFKPLIETSNSLRTTDVCYSNLD